MQPASAAAPGPPPVAPQQPTAFPPGPPGTEPGRPESREVHRPRRPGAAHTETPPGSGPPGADKGWRAGAAPTLAQTPHAFSADRTAAATAMARTDRAPRPRPPPGAGEAWRCRPSVWLRQAG